MRAFEVMAGLVLDDERTWIDAATDVQVSDARAWLEDPAPYHFTTRARGYSKTQDAAAAAVADLLTMPPNSRLYWLAADRDQGALAIESIEGFKQRTKLVGQTLEVQTWKVTNPTTGSTLAILAADVAGSWGLRPDRLYIDELAQWTEAASSLRLFEAATTALTKRPGARMIIITTAGDPAHFSHKLLSHAHVSDLWRVSETAGPAPWTDPVRLAEQKARLADSAYARLYENRWVEPEDRLTNVEDLVACSTLSEWPLEPTPGRGPYLVTVDVGLKNDRTVVAVTHHEDRGDTAGVRVVLDRMATWQGSRANPVALDAVEAYVLEVAMSYGARICLDPYQAAQLAQRLRARGCSVEEFTFSASSVGRLGAALYTSLRDHALALPPADHEEAEAAQLHDELANVRLRETSPGVIRLDHGRGHHDDRAITLALAVNWFREHLVFDHHEDEVIVFDPDTGRLVYEDDYYPRSIGPDL